MKKFLEEFKAFALRGNVMDMAVGVLIGGAFSGIVTSLTDNFIQPIIKLVMTGKVYTLEEISGYASAFGSSVVNFLIMAFILFCLLKAMNKVMSFGSKPEEPAQPTTKICPFCMSEIDLIKVPKSIITDMMIDSDQCFCTSDHCCKWFITIFRATI